ncbi:hypothetical protein ACOMHN_051425 [Nucella lapillus]
MCKQLTKHHAPSLLPFSNGPSSATAVKETAQSTLGPKKRIHQDWFDENDVAIAQLLEDKRKSFTAWQNDTTSTSKRDRFKHLQSHAQAMLRDMQDKWWKKKADEVQLYADTKNSKMFFSAIKAVYGPSGLSTMDSLDAPPTMEEGLGPFPLYTPDIRQCQKRSTAERHLKHSTTVFIHKRHFYREKKGKRRKFKPEENIDMTFTYNGSRGKEVYSVSSIPETGRLLCRQFRNRSHPRRAVESSLIGETRKWGSVGETWEGRTMKIF